MTKQFISKICKIGTLISMYGLILSVVIQIFARIFLAHAPAWTEEASRMFFIYAIAFAAGPAFESKYYIGVQWLFDKFSIRVQKIIDRITMTILCVFFLIMTWYAFEFTLMGYQEKSPGMKIRMAFVFFSMVILSGSLAFYIGVYLKENKLNREL